jgi:hypothetical protein
LAWLQRSLQDLRAIDERSVGRAQVADQHIVAIDYNLAMSAGNGRILDAAIVGKTSPKQVRAGF